MKGGALPRNSNAAPFWVGPRFYLISYCPKQELRWSLWVDPVGDQSICKLSSQTGTAAPPSSGRQELWRLPCAGGTATQCNNQYVMRISQPTPVLWSPRGIELNLLECPALRKRRAWTNGASSLWCEADRVKAYEETVLTEAAANSERPTTLELIHEADAFCKMSLNVLTHEPSEPVVRLSVLRGRLLSLRFWALRLMGGLGPQQRQQTQGSWSGGPDKASYCLLKDGRQVTAPKPRDTSSMSSNA